MLNSIYPRTVLVLLGWMQVAFSHSQTLNLSDLPLSVQSEIPANIIVSLDDSGSMAWGWMPDGLNNNWRRNFYRSSHYNKIYYSPSVTYTPPSVATGASASNANFDAAIRGYYYADDRRDVVNLRTSFSAIYHHYSYQDALLLDDRYIDNGCPTCAKQPAYYFEFSEDNAGCNGSAAEKRVDQDCYNQIVVTDGANYAGGTNNYGRTQAEEEANFANWYQFYAIRADASKSAIQRAFVPDAVSDSVRVGRQALNTDQSIRSGGPSQDNQNIAEFDRDERAGFYEWVQSVPTNGGTPLRNAIKRAGDYFTQDTAYRTNASSNSGPIVACRINTHILVTDGFYNGDWAAPNNFKLDQTNRILPDGENYVTATAPIYSNPLDSQSLSDLTFHYWATDLRPEPNNITPFKSEVDGADPEDYWHPRNDPATWQHMNSFGIAFGAEGTVSTDDATFAALLAGTQNWPQTLEGQSTTIDDMYHAAINGRGEFFNAANPNELVDALNKITDRIAERSGNVPTIGASSGRITDGTKVYIASFATESWSGDLRAYTVSDGSDFRGSGTTTAVGCNAKPLGAICNEDSPDWSAAAKNDELDLHLAPASRNIFTYDNTSVQGAGAPSGSGIDFRWQATTQLNAEQQALLNDDDGLGQERVYYFRGKDEQELDNGGVFRTRSSIAGRAAPASRVGAIVHSNPVYAGPGGDDLQFSFPDDLEASAYSINSRSAVVYVGGNDGMLHGYDASDSASAGQEVFAYVPNAIIKNLPDLTNPDFKSGAFVDGPLTIQDAFYDGQWRSLLVGGLRSGGQGFFALNVTDPPSERDADPAPIVQWEFTDHDDPDMGYTYGTPIIAKANNGEWVVIVANGYNSLEADGNEGSGKAVLYVLAADDGELLAKFEVGNGSASNPSGLSSPTAVSDFDINNFATKASGTDPDNFTVDYVYAGDLDGNLWKFDISATNPTQWNDAVLMYSAGNSKPITAKPAVGTFPTRSAAVGNEQTRFVYFGTGQYIDPVDVSSTAAQSFYGIIDSDSCTSASEACITYHDLVEQSIISNDTISNNALAVSDKGWRLDLYVGGSAERMLDGISVVSDVVAFTSVAPREDACGPAGVSYLYALNRFSGGLTSRQVIDFDNDAAITSNDYPDGTVRSRKPLDFIVLDASALRSATGDFLDVMQNSSAIITGLVSATIDQGGFAFGALLATDVDGLTDDGYFSIVVSPVYGQAQINSSSGVWVYLADSLYVGSDYFTIAVTDDLGNITTQVIAITVEGIDTDADTVYDFEDNCPSTPNSLQENVDNDALGDVCDDDIDGDNVSNALDAFPYDATETMDTDADLVGDNADNCVTDFNPSQSNVDGDAYGDFCDDDIDGDGLSNVVELRFGGNTNDASDSALVMANIESLALNGFADTDNDSVPDAFEIELGTDLNDAQDAQQALDTLRAGFAKAVPAVGGFGLLLLGLSMATLGFFRRKR